MFLRVCCKTVSDLNGVVTVRTCDVSWFLFKINEHSAGDLQGKTEEDSSLDLFLACLHFCKILPDLCVQ